jgi:ubiquinol-cytochrome c reductase cytochrome c subunit
MVVAAAAFGAVVSARVVIEGAQAPAAASGNLANGRAAFSKAGCETCHGPQGAGTAAAPSLVSSALPIKDFIAYVRQPRGTMPPHPPQVVSDTALADIYAFVHQKTAAPAAAQTSAAPAGDVAAGGKLYGSIGCYQCHSNEGQGGAQGPRLGPSPVPFARFSSYTRHPTGEMPPYTAAVLTDQGLADIYAWLQARPQPPALNSVPLLAP